MGRTIAIGDIHGCNRTFNQLLFSVIKLEKSDSLFLLGDYIDRGPDSKGVIDTILTLKKEGYDINAIKGNHESMLLEAITSGYSTLWLESGGTNTLKSYNIEHQDEIEWNHIQFMLNLPLEIVTEKYVFVHAGLDFTLDDPIRDSTQAFKLWERFTTVIPKNISNRKVIAGHTVRTLAEIKKSIKKGFIQLDNGCFLGSRYKGRGSLIAFDLDNINLFIQKKID